jgi:ubiquinone biosynthesis protein UbiJ
VLVIFFVDALPFPRVIRGLQDCSSHCINYYLGLDPETLPRLSELEGKTLKVVVKGWGVFYMHFTQEGIRLSQDYADEAHACITGSSKLFLCVALAQGRNAVDYARDFEIQGDTELVYTLQRVLQQNQIDWEEVLSRVFGDVVAHQLGNMARSIKYHGQHAGQNLTKNLRAYLQEESRLLPPRAEVEDFFTEIYAVSNAVERLTARLKSLRY